MATEGIEPSPPVPRSWTGVEESPRPSTAHTAPVLSISTVQPETTPAVRGAGKASCSGTELAIVKNSAAPETLPPPHQKSGSSDVPLTGRSRRLDGRARHQEEIDKYFLRDDDRVLHRAGGSDALLFSKNGGE